jgi:hypothetical protein
MRRRTLIVAFRRKLGWQVVREVVSTTVDSVHATQAVALAEARARLAGEGGGVVRVKGKDGRFRMRRRVEG